MAFVAAAPVASRPPLVLPATRPAGLVVVRKQLANIGETVSTRATASRRCTAVHMGFADRFSRVVRSNVNKQLNNMEDPERIIEQSVADMQTEIRKVRTLYEEIAGTAQRIQLQKEQALRISGEWYKRAQLALSRGDEPLAREALMRKTVEDERAKNLEKQLAGIRANLSKLADSIVALESKIAEARAMKQDLMIRARRAQQELEIRTRITEMTAGVNSLLDSVNSESGLAAFERMREKVERLEAENESYELLLGSGNSTRGSEAKFRQLEMDSAVDAQINAMRAAMPKRMLGPSSNAPGSSRYIEIEINDPHWKY